MSIYRIRTEMGHYFKWVLLLVVVPIFVLGSAMYFGGGSLPGMDDNKQADRVVAKVNGLEVTLSEFEGSWENTVQQLRDAGVRSPLQFAEYRRNLFNQLVQTRLIIIAAQQMGVDVSDRAIDEQVDKAIVERLKAERKQALGTLTPEEEKVDPRKDDKFAEALAGITTIREREDMYRRMIPRGAFAAQVAGKAIMDKIQASVGKATDQDARNSYNVYSITQIMLPKGNLPEEQIEAKANKILLEAKGGADFNKLAKSSDNALSKTGGKGQYSFDMRFMQMPEVRQAIEALKPGGISPVIKTAFGYSIVKLDSVKPQLPPKVDAKVLAERRKQIDQDKLQSAMMKFETELKAKQKIEVLDNELRGYWQVSQAEQAYGDPKKMKMYRDMAEKSLRDAMNNSQSKPYAMSKLAQMKLEDGDNKEAALLLEKLVNDKSTVASADLYLMYADLLVKQGKKDDAIANYKLASEMARLEADVHKQLVDRYKQLGRPELVAAEKAWIADYDQRVTLLKQRQGKEAPTSVPVSAPKKTK